MEKWIRLCHSIFQMECPWCIPVDLNGPLYPEWYVIVVQATTKNVRKKCMEPYRINDYMHASVAICKSLANFVGLAVIGFVSTMSDQKFVIYANCNKTC